MRESKKDSSVGQKDSQKRGNFPFGRHSDRFVCRAVSLRLCVLICNE